MGGDVEALGRGMKAVVDEGRWLATQPNADLAELTERYRRSLDEGRPLFVLEEGGEVVGCLGLNPTHARGVLELGGVLGVRSDRADRAARLAGHDRSSLRCRRATPPGWLNR